MRKLLLILLLLPHLLFSQDIKINKQYTLAPSLINPAFTGNTLCFEANLMSTFQWFGIDNSPRTYLLTAEKGFNGNKFDNFSRHGLGATVYNDLNGPYSFTGVRAAYAFHAYLDKNKVKRISLGLSATGTWFRLNQSLLYQNSAYLPSNPALNYSMNSSILPNVATGVVFTVKKLYVGVSALNLIPLYPAYESAPVGKRCYYFITGYKAYFKGSNIGLEPILVYNLANNGIQTADATLKLLFHQKIVLGLTYRHSLISIPGSPNSFAVRFGLVNNRWTYSYMYDLGFNSLQFNSFGNHEICIGYRICPFEKSKCPAYQ